MRIKSISTSVACAMVLSVFSAESSGAGAVDFVRNNELKTVFASGLAVRAAATAIGSALSPILFNQIDKLTADPALNNGTNGIVAVSATQEQSFVRGLLSVLTGVDISIALWLAPQMIYQYCAGLKAGDHRSELFDLSYSSGMDTYLFLTAFISAYEAIQKLYQERPALGAPDDSLTVLDENGNCTAQFPVIAGQEQSSQIRAVATAFLTAGIVEWLSFELGYRIGIKAVGKDSIDKKRIVPTFFLNWILFNVGIGLIITIEKMFFKIGDYFGFTQNCDGCRAAYQAGSDWGYVLSYPVGILTGYWALYKALHKPHVA